MTQFIAQCIDNGIMALLAGLLLRYYFKPGVKRLYKKKWVLVGCTLMILYSVVEFGLTYREHIMSRLPSSKTVINTIQKSGQIVSKDFIFSSEDGYQILIPSGYTYISSQAGRLSLTATKDYSAFNVVKRQHSASFDEIIDKVSAVMKKRNSTFRIDNRRKMHINESEVVRIDCHATKNNIPVKLILILCRKSDMLFQLTLSCHQESFAGLEAEYETILTSFKID